MCRPLGDPAVKPSGEDVVSICSDDIIDELISDSLEAGHPGNEIKDNALPTQFERLPHRPSRVRKLAHRLSRMGTRLETLAHMMSYMMKTSKWKLV
eukprot:3708445-Pyramimonas_sp.AAC.1